MMKSVHPHKQTKDWNIFLINVYTNTYTLSQIFCVLHTNLLSSNIVSNMHEKGAVSLKLLLVIILYIVFGTSVADVSISNLTYKLRI